MNFILESLFYPFLLPSFFFLFSHSNKRTMWKSNKENESHRNPNWLWNHSKEFITMQKCWKFIEKTIQSISLSIFSLPLCSPSLSSYVCWSFFDVFPFYMVGVGKSIYPFIRWTEFKYPNYLKYNRIVWLFITVLHFFLLPFFIAGEYENRS